MDRIYHDALKNYTSISFQIEWDMIVVTVLSFPFDVFSRDLTKIDINSWDGALILIIYNKYVDCRIVTRVIHPI